MNLDNLKYWVALSKIEGLGPVKLKRALERYGGSAKDLCLALKASQKDAEKEIEEAQKKNISILTLEDSHYPQLLKEIHSPPPVLYIKGSLDKIEKSIAIVGTRTATRYGQEIACKLASELAGLGICVVSGLAFGIDSEAHRGALRVKGKTVAVLGSGADRIFPPSNRNLAYEILETQGAIMSEFPLGFPPAKWTFPQRNRIISGLSMGVIVVEGHYNSGAMITAKCALDQGREVFAVPGNVELDQSKGPHWLIKQGAKLIESVDDVLEELNMARTMTNVPTFAKASAGKQLPMTNEGRDYTNLSSDEQKIVSVLSLEPKHIDMISAESGFLISQVSSLLMMLEVKKIIRQLPGKMFVLL